MGLLEGSAQPCGCDPGCGNGYQCEQHTANYAGIGAEDLMRDTIPAYAPTAKNRATILPTDSKERKHYPIVSGVLDYFPDAIAEIALVSWQGNEQHNPGQPLHWAREKSTDHEDCIGRHTLQRGTRDTDGMRHSAKRAWRALAALQLEIESEGK